MKQTIILLFISTLLGLTFADSCPNNVEKPVVKPDPESCRHFTVCLPGGVTVQGYCGGDLLFDEDRFSCLPKEQVDCHGRPHVALNAVEEQNLGSEIVFDEVADLFEMIVSEDLITRNETSHCPANSKPGQFVLVPHETDCDKFYMCMGPKETLKVCRKGQLFNKEKHRCDKAENVKCDSDVTTDGPTEPEKSHCPTDGKPGRFVLVPHETDCDKFYMCMGPKETLKVCRKGQLFNKEKHRCDKAENVQCDSDVTTTVSPFLNFVEEPEEGHCPADADPKRLVRVAHETDCDKYYLCYNGKEKLHTCKQGKLFSELRNHCLTANKVDCGDRTTAAPTTTTETPETENPFINEESEKHCPENNTRVTRVAHETDCDKYWLCAGPREKLKECKEGKLFSVRHSVCLSEHKVECGDRTTAVPTTTTETPETTTESTNANDASPMTPDCPNNHRFELFPHPESCHKFFVCRNGEAFERECRDNYVFDKLKKRCVKDEDSDCTYRGAKPNPLKPTMTPLNGSCRKFVFQFQYRKYNFECKDGFWFDPAFKHCSKDREGVCSHEKASK